ncbi:hypothetical protein [Streptomyces lydicus]|uniref:hypothetical protein n=1 Tax=Streptomyces lydicus TaxID=47763 RepID=UPI00286FCAF4|nr:hypothetical protein [Streptomyces lydicus]
MTRCDGVLIEFCQGEWGTDETMGLTLSVWGRAAHGRRFTEADAQRPLAGLQDIDLLVENCGCPFVSEDGKQEAIDLLAAAFPGAEIRCYEPSEADEGGLEAAGASLLWEHEITWARCAICCAQ